MTRHLRPICTLLLILAAACQQRCRAPAATAKHAAPLTCGIETCSDEQICEGRYKGHSIDSRGRPLERQKCMPLPDQCRTTPSCECVTRVVAAQHCDDQDGHVRLDDYPR